MHYVDVGGVRIVPQAPAIPPTPPPDVDLEAWHRSMEVITAWRPECLAMTHWGASEEVEDQLQQVAERLDRWAVLAREHDEQAWVQAVREELRRDASPEVFEAYLQAVPSDQAYAGLERYWAKRAAA